MAQRWHLPAIYRRRCRFRIHRKGYICIMNHNEAIDTYKGSCEFQVFVKPVGARCNLRCSYCYYLEKDLLLHRSGGFRMTDEVLKSMSGSILRLREGRNSFSPGMEVNRHLPALTSSGRLWPFRSALSLMAAGSLTGCRQMQR